MTERSDETAVLDTISALPATREHAHHEPDIVRRAVA